MELIPAILAKSKKEFSEKLRRVGGRFRTVQIDIMDGTFVRGRSWADPAAVARMRSRAQFELHLMVRDPRKHMLRWAREKRVRRVIFHIEATRSAAAVCAILAMAYELGWETAIAVNPRTPLSRLKYFIEDIDAVMLMGVTPGKSGQRFMPATLKKIAAAAAAWDLPIAVDGGVDAETAPAMLRAGATRLCSGSAIFSLTPAAQARWVRDLHTIA